MPSLVQFVYSMCSFSVSCFFQSALFVELRSITVLFLVECLYRFLENLLIYLETL